MSKKNDGAFAYHTQGVTQRGMTTRQFVAMNVLSALISGHVGKGRSIIDTNNIITEALEFTDKFLEQEAMANDKHDTRI